MFISWNFNAIYLKFLIRFPNMNLKFSANNTYNCYNSYFYTSVYTDVFLYFVCRLLQLSIDHQNSFWKETSCYKIIFNDIHNSRICVVAFQTFVLCQMYLINKIFFTINITFWKHVLIFHVFCFKFSDIILRNPKILQLI